MDLITIKQRFDIIGNDAELNRAIEIAMQVAPTDLSVLITGESGVGKENIPRIIHECSPRKHNKYIAVNCGAIPEGTIDSELFGHEKGAFTGAIEARKGYFEEANEGTIFLDEVAELPLSTQVRLLRVLQTGEFIRVGSSKPQKTNVRVIAATNVNLKRSISEGKFREDLFYRLNTVPIHIPPLRRRSDDIHRLFQKFALDFANKYSVPSVTLTDEAKTLLENYKWPGNIRELKSVAERISILESTRRIDAAILANYLPTEGESSLPISLKSGENSADYLSDRDIIFKILYQLKQEISELRSRVDKASISSDQKEDFPVSKQNLLPAIAHPQEEEDEQEIEDQEIQEEEDTNIKDSEENSLTIKDKSNELILKALKKHNNNRAAAAEELGISVRTLYRKLKKIKV